MQHFSYENVIRFKNIQLKRQYNNETKAEKNGIRVQGGSIVLK